MARPPTPNAVKIGAIEMPKDWRIIIKPMARMVIRARLEKIAVEGNRDPLLSDH